MKLSLRIKLDIESNLFTSLDSLFLVLFSNLLSQQYFSLVQRFIPISLTQTQSNNLETAHSYFEKIILLLYSAIKGENVQSVRFGS